MAEPDLFTRLADPGRGTGAITPRVQPLFEPDAAEVDPFESLAGVDEQVGAPDPVTAAAETARSQAVAPRPPAAGSFAPGTPAPPPAPGPARLPRAQDAVRPDQAQSAPRPDQAAREFEVSVRKADDGEPARLRPREVAVVEAPSTARADRRAGESTARRGATSEAGNAAQPPEVYISIGRIEVRAIPAAQAPAAAVPQRAPQPQGPTLAQYLRGDDGRPR
jgi:hypothetical protein